MDYKETYSFWKNHLAGTEYETEINKIGDDEKLKEDSFYQYLEFGTAGMRGTIALGTNRMNVFTVRRSTQGLADYIKQMGQMDRGVAIAYDSRLHSDDFALETALVLAQNGIHVYLYECLHSVPQLSYAVLKLNAFAGVVITASHNPAQYNGYKVYGEDGGQLAVEDAATVTDYINKIDDVFAIKTMDREEAVKRGILQYVGKEIDESYYQDLKTLIINKEALDAQKDKLNIVYTPLHGTGNIPVRHMLTELGIKNLHVVKEQEMPDSRFPTVKAPNPEEPDAFVLATKLANEKGANMILATDPDCDRLGVAVRIEDNSFKVLTGNQIGCLLMDYILSQKQKGFTGDEFVVKSIVSTNMADVIAGYYHVELRDVLTGFKFIAEQIKLSEQSKKGHFLFGFEESYGFLSGTFVRDKDACNAAMLVTEMCCYYAQKDMTLYDALCALYEKYGYFKEEVTSKSLSGIEGIAKIKNAVETLRKDGLKEIGGFKVSILRDFETQKATEVETGTVTPIALPKSNVLYFELEGGARFILRPSGTEPKLKAYITASGKTEPEAKEKFERLKKAVTEMVDHLTA